MALKFVVLAALVAAANAGYLGGYAAAPLGYAAHAVAPAAVTSQHSNILRSYGNLGQVSTYSKTIDTPYSSVRKSDVRVSNDALAYHAAPAIAAYHAAPAVAAYHAAPAVAAYHAAPAVAAYSAPAVAAYGGYAAPYAARYAAPAAYAAPIAAHAAYAAPIAAHGLIGTAYSAAPAVAHISYSNAYGINYAY